MRRARRPPCGLGAERGHRLLGVLVTPVPQQPAGRLRHLGAQRQPDQRRDRAEPEDQPPADGGRAARERAEDDQRDDVGDQDPDRDHPLLQHGQRTAPALRRVLGDVGGGDGRVRADGEPDHRPGDEQHGGVGRYRGQDRAERVDAGIDDEQHLAAEMIGDRARPTIAPAAPRARLRHQVAADQARAGCRGRSSAPSRCSRCRSRKGSRPGWPAR